MIITKDITRHIAFDASQEILKWLGDEMAKCERRESVAEDVRWKALFDCLDFVEKWRFEKEYEVTEETTTKVKAL